MPILPPEPAPPPPPKPKKKGCGVIGQVIAVVIAIVVTAATYGALTGAGGAFAGATGLSASTVAAGAIAGAAGSIASQGFLMATGAQSKFDWGGLAISAISAGVSKGLSGSSGFGGFLDKVAGKNDFLRGAITQASANVITQGVSMAAGLQSRFDWTGVAVAGISGGFSASIGPSTFGDAANWSARGLANGLVQNGVGALAGAATRVAIDGGDFGDALERAIPDVIGNTIGNMVAGQLSQPREQGSPNDHGGRGAHGSGASSSGSDLDGPNNHSFFPEISTVTMVDIEPLNIDGFAELKLSRIDPTIEAPASYAGKIDLLLG